MDEDIQFRGEGDQPGTSAISREIVREELDRILKSAQMAEKRTMGRLLQYLVNASLEGEAVTESRIAQEVFERKDYEPKSESFVRSTMANLRRSLSEYYGHEEGKVRIVFSFARGSGYRLEIVPQTLERRLQSSLSRNGINVASEVAIGGLNCDLVMRTPDGQLIIVETKHWAPTEENKNRAISQAKLLKMATDAAAAIMVLDGLDEGKPSEGLFSEREALRFLIEAGSKKLLKPKEAPKYPFSEFLSETESFPAEEERRRPVEVFAAMPFTAAYDDVYFVAMTHAAASVNAVCRRIDKEDFEGDIVERIKTMIGSSRAVISDLSESKPNVLYETGFAHALGLPTVHICSTPMGELPFDVRNWNTLRYEKGQTFKLRDPLSQRLKAAMKLP